MKQRTAILIFTNSAKKLLHTKVITSAEFFNIIEAKTLKTVQKTGLPYFHFPESQQNGINFGERFSNAIASVFEKGFQNVITIGSDIPHINTRILKKASSRLQNKSCVLGPSTDGGFYLMSFNKKDFDKESFAALPWETKTLKQNFICDLTSKNLEFSLLEPLSDIDSSEDIIMALKSSRLLPKSLKRLFSKLVRLTKHIFSPNKMHHSLFGVSKLFNKGSPVILSN
ncbi:hypothetical protein PW52_00790 [Tamlana sedimentorum]|uniref:DUF2064 domain-containing protein n=1 Tax=Neotamlana sedimentorum TaxID=1435349 RepID=A0A0D7WE99_9FLAO|nr:DUF2064 domain-containing protein [Tamlana sedimentorum]KJD37028.1 hypothetical protein PW52_00790 [Tamlana sedimentorum]